MSAKLAGEARLALADGSEDEAVTAFQPRLDGKRDNVSRSRVSPQRPRKTKGWATGECVPGPVPVMPMIRSLAGAPMDETPNEDRYVDQARDQCKKPSEFVDIPTCTGFEDNLR
ncbi:MAG: hypothetical protein M1821_004149 [Bathelium mastoideum]|nr:MAG: hypothetical protein M1821_004149 [Bathelium mastoideum]